jgi:hypothetical protein
MSPAGLPAYRPLPGLILRSAQSKKRSPRRSSRFALPTVCPVGWRSHVKQSVLSKFTRQRQSFDAFQDRKAAHILSAFASGSTLVVWPKNRNDGRTVGAIAPAQVYGSRLVT